MSSSDSESSTEAKNYLVTKLAPLRIPLEDILIATKDFAEENLLKRGEKADAYKGLLFFQSKVGIDVVIRKFGHQFDAFEFYKEIRKISRVKHRNIVSLIGFCDEKDERMIVMERLVNGSLDKYLCDPATLTWSQRLHICFGAALALKSIHYYIHGGIRCFKILLDIDWEAKVLVCTKSISSWYDTKKSYVYSLGVILLEMLNGRKATTTDVSQYLVKKQYEEVDDMIDPNLRKQMLPESLSIFTEITYNCLNEKRDQQRPYMYQIVPRLREAFEIQWKHENPIRMENFAYLKIPLRQIKLATCIKSDGYDAVYKAELIHFDRESALTMEGEDELGELPKKPVIIKRFNEKTTKDFFAEIEMLSSCKHPNLLTLLGFCDEDSEMILVFECPTKGTLEYYLESNSLTNLTWEQRIRICLDITHGMKYLHNLEGKPSMIYQGISPANVFLDEKCTTKIAHFTRLESNSYPASFGQSGKRRVVC